VMSRRRGFTLIELLVVIAIIAILAAMLFPVFARARESARKIQCLSNVKNIAMAFQMYLTDYDRFNPSEHRAEVIDAFNGGGPNLGSCGCGGGRQCCTDRIAEANPYLKVPVILDEYIKNRDVWRCASAYASSTFEIMNTYLNSKGTDDWFLRYQESQSSCPAFKSCHEPFPSGWGGAVTDSVTNQVWCTPDPGPGVFEMEIGVNGSSYDRKTGEINDPARYVVCGDGGINHVTAMDETPQLAYPDMCRIGRVGCADPHSSCGADWTNCSWARDCGPNKNDPANQRSWATDANFRKTHGHTRHLGGSNIGFADGHASWMASEAIYFAGEPSWRGIGSGQLEGITTCVYPYWDP